MPDSKPNRTKRIFLLLRILLVAAGIVFAIVWLSNERRWTDLKEIFRRMNIWIFACTLAIFVFSQVIIGLRWWLLLRTQAIFIPFWAAVRLYLLGWFYNNVMPSSVGGDLIRLWYVTKHTEKKFEAGLSVLVDRVIGLASTLIIAVFFYLVFIHARGQKIEFTTENGLLSSLARYKWLFLSLALAVAAPLAALLLHAKGRAVLQKLCCSVRKHAAGVFKKLTNAALLYRTKPLAILAAFALTVILQIATITGFWLLGRNLGIQAGIEYYYTFFTIVWVVGAIPVSIGGAVVMEVILAGLFVKFAGVDETAAAALALCQRFIWILASLPGAVIHLIGAHLPRISNLTDQEKTGI